MVGIIDYGAGNLRSVLNSFLYLGKEAKLITTPEEAEKSDFLVLPGNGAFGDCANALREIHMDEAIHNFIKRGNPFLGICIGMQMLFTESLEFGAHKGFNYINGQVKRFPQKLTDMGMKIPHTGWNCLDIRNNNARIFRDIPNGSYFYFVHSYYADTADQSAIAATSDYEILFTAAVAKDNIVGTQFHPEKSQQIGLKLLKNFCAM